MTTLPLPRFLALLLLLLAPQWSWSEEPAGDAGSKPAQQSVQVVMATTAGDVTLELFPDLAPVTVQNFLQYADSGFYNGLIFHRVIPDFMIQGGGFDPSLNRRETRAPIRNEANNGLLNGRGTIAMARTSDINSATAQFFINLKHNTFLNHGARDYGYAVFGRVLQGMEVVDGIAGVPTRRAGPHANLPVTPVVIRSVKRVPPEPAQ